MKDKLIYLTYQTFPSLKANTIQTVDNLNYLSEFFEIELLFPLRESQSTDDKKILSNYYNISKKIKVNGLKHNYPFGKFKIYEKLLFMISQYLWAKKIVKKFKNNKDNIYFFTRSDWIFYFLSKFNNKVTFECHQLSKTRKYVMKKSIKHKNSKIIFLNNYLKIDSGIDTKLYDSKLKVIQNGVDSKLFKKNLTRSENELIFIGNLQRFGEHRNLEFFISSFKNKKMPKDINFTVIGTPEIEVSRLKTYIERNGLENRITVKNWLKREQAIEYIEKSGMGLLTNTESNSHSVKYTSPLKYFEYIYGGLRVIATNYPAHKDLPFAEKIHFFENGDEESFISCVKKARKENSIDSNTFESITLKNRSKEIYNFIT